MQKLLLSSSADGTIKMWKISEEYGIDDTLES